MPPSLDCYKSHVTRGIYRQISLRQEKNPLTLLISTQKTFEDLPQNYVNREHKIPATSAAIWSQSPSVIFHNNVPWVYKHNHSLLYIWSLQIFDQHTFFLFYPWTLILCPSLIIRLQIHRPQRLNLLVRNCDTCLGGKMPLNSRRICCSYETWSNQSTSERKDLQSPFYTCTTRVLLCSMGIWPFNWVLLLLETRAVHLFQCVNCLRVA